MYFILFWGKSRKKVEVYLYNKVCFCFFFLKKFFLSVYLIKKLKKVWLEYLVF